MYIVSATKCFNHLQTKTSNIFRPPPPRKKMKSGTLGGGTYTLHFRTPSAKVYRLRGSGSSNMVFVQVGHSRVPPPWQASLPGRARSRLHGAAAPVRRLRALCEGFARRFWLSGAESSASLSELTGKARVNSTIIVSSFVILPYCGSKVAVDVAVWEAVPLPACADFVCRNCVHCSVQVGFAAVSRFAFCPVLVWAPTGIEKENFESSACR